MTSSVTAKPCLRLEGWLYGRELDHLNATALTLQKVQVDFLKAIIQNMPSRVDRRSFLATQFTTAPAAVWPPEQDSKTYHHKTHCLLLFFSLTHSANFVSCPPPISNISKAQMFWAPTSGLYITIVQRGPLFKCVKVNNIPEEMHTMKSN